MPTQKCLSNAILKLECTCITQFSCYARSMLWWAVHLRVKPLPPSLLQTVLCSNSRVLTIQFFFSRTTQCSMQCFPVPPDQGKYKDMTYPNLMPFSSSQICFSSYHYNLRCQSFDSANSLGKKSQNYSYLLVF